MYRPLKRLAEAVQAKLGVSGQEAHSASSVSRGEQETEEEQRFNAEFRQALVKLEKLLHATEDPSVITMESLKTVCAFYNADWAGILILDRTAEMWGPAVWYEPGTGEMAPTLFNDVEYFENFPRWVKAIETGEPIIIRDIDADGIPPEEAAQYRRLATHGVIGAPFGDRPTGFLVVRNPMRYPGIPDFAQMLAFVTLSSYYLQELQSGMQMMYETSEGKPTDEGAVTIRLFGVPEIITPTGQINEGIYHSENGWKLLTYLALHKTPIPARSIATALWPDENQEIKSGNIRHIIYRFKSKLAFLQPNELIVNTPSGYCLNPELKIRCDVDEFDEMCSQSEKATDTKSKIENLKKAAALFRGDIYAKYSHEHWLMGQAAFYQMKYLDVSTQLMSLLAGEGDYPAVQEVALQASKVVPGNVSAYYWMTVSLYQLGGKDAAQKVVESIRSKLTEEEFEDLKRRLSERIQ